MLALRTLALCPLLCLTLLAAPALSQNAPAAAKKTAPVASAADKAAMNQTIDDLIALLDGDSKRSRLDSMETLHKAGFSYEKHLLAPTTLDLSCKTADERNVVAGMRSVDWDYALFFGQPATVGRVCILPYQSTNTGKGKRTIASPPLADSEWNTVTNNPASPQARDILMRRSADFQRKLLEEARKNPEALEALGARLYGATLQSLYITSILVLAAQESDSLDYLKKLHKGTFARQNKVFQLLLRNKHFGDKEHNHERAALVAQVLALLEQSSKDKGARLKNIEEVLHIIQPERDRYLSPCPPKAKGGSGGKGREKK